MVAEPAQRVVPGAPPSQAKTVAKKKKQKGGQQSPATNGARSHSQEAISKAAKEASLMEKAPNHDKVNDSVKIQVKDLAEEAERNGAIAAAQIMVEKENGSSDKESRSALQVILTKRIKVLSKKLQKAIAYEELSEDKINADMRKIIESKPALEAGVAELTQASKALQIAEQQADKHAKEQTKLAIEATRKDIMAENERKGAVLFQFMHLYSLTQPSAVPTFAPPPMPAALALATSREVAAVGKLYADFSSSAEVVPQDTKHTLVGKLVSGSKDDILDGVSFQRVLELVEGLSNQVVEQPEVEAENVVKGGEETASSHPAATEPTGSIHFMQASEISEAPLEVADEVKQAEPEGGAIDGIPASVIKGGATERGQAGAKGTILGETASHSTGKEDGTARAEVDEPVQTTEVGAGGAAKTAAEVLNGGGPKSVDWANDDDDWGDMMMQPTPDPKLAGASKATEAPKVNGVSTAKVEQPKQPQASKGANDQQRGDVQQSKPLQEATQPTAAAAAAAPPPPPSPATSPAAKGGVQVDEDGFVTIVKKPKQQQPQQQQGSRNANRGGRGGFRGQGQGARGGHASRGSGFGDTRGRGRGRSGRLGAEHSSET